MLFSCRKYVILERSSWKLPSALSKNCVSIFIYFCINICFCIRQANKICTLLSSHLLALIVFSVRCCCFMRGATKITKLWNGLKFSYRRQTHFLLLPRPFSSKNSVGTESNKLSLTGVADRSFLNRKISLFPWVPT